MTEIEFGTDGHPYPVGDDDDNEAEYGTEAADLIAHLEAESATKDEVIRRLLDGWEPLLSDGYWQQQYAKAPNEPMSDAHRAVLEGLQ